MATSGTIQGTTKNSSGADRTANYGTWITWKRNSNSIANNTSNVTISVSTQRIDGYTGETAWNLINKPSVSLKVGGTAKSATVDYIDTRGQKVCTFATWTGDVAHNANGSLNLSIECSWTLPNMDVLASGYISGTATLDTIPRASTISAVSDKPTIGEEVTITISRADSSFTHQVWYKVGNSGWYDVGKGYGTSAKFTVAYATAWNIPNSMTGTMQICVRTYSGATQIGNDYYKDVTVSAPSYSLVGSIALTGNNLLSGAYVQGKSTVTATITTSSSQDLYGATIKSISSTIDGKTYSGSTFTTSALSNGSKTVSTTITDSRGKTVTVTSSAITVYAYSTPSITEFTLARQSDGTTVIATVKGSVSAVNNKNAKTIQVTLNDVTQTITSSAYTINGTTTFANIPTDNTFTGTAKITDSYTNATKDYVLPTVAVTMDYLADGKGIAMGKVSETTDLLDVAWSGRIRKNLTVNGTHSVGSNATVGGTLGVTGITTLNQAATIADNNLAVLTLKRNNDANASTIRFQNNSGTLGYIGMTGTTPNGGLRRWTADSATVYTFLDTDNTKDYITEQGTSGVWRYVKWNSGFAECWGYHTISGTNISTAWGAWYASPVITLPSFPFTFSGAPDVHVSWESDFSAIIDGVSKRESTKAGQVYLYRPVAQTNVNGRFSIYAYGRWK